MIVYRVGKKQFSGDLSGEGARLFGGRWNSIGVPCLYASESRALALLEFSVNISADSIADDLRFTLIEIPDSAIIQINIDQLPIDWNSFPFKSTTQLFGSRLFASNAAVLKIPSTVINSEWNYLLNPRHNHFFDSFKIISFEDYRYDLRIKI